MSDSSQTANTGGDDSPIVDPGERKVFVYVGEMIPNQVLITNMDSEREAQVVMQGLGEGDRPGWSWYDTILPGKTVSVWVSWPTKALVTNRGSFAAVEVGGDGIFTQQGMKSGDS